MSRYIDADALTKEIKQDIADEGLTERFVFYRINEAPSIDIVRCGECRLGGTEDCPMDEIDDEYFCNFGEREGE